MNKIKIVRGIQASYEIEEDIKPDTDYLMTFKVSREGVAQKDPHGEGTEPLKFLMVAECVQGLKEIGEHHKEIEIKIDSDKYSPSQIQRFAINDALAKFVDNKDQMEKQYEVLMSKNVRMFNLMKELGLDPVETTSKMVAWLESKKI